jgi:hypothetical protein
MSTSNEQDDILYPIKAINSSVSYTIIKGVWKAIVSMNDQEINCVCMYVCVRVKKTWVSKTLKFDQRFSGVRNRMESLVFQNFQIIIFANTRPFLRKQWFFYNVWWKILGIGKSIGVISSLDWGESHTIKTK